MPYIGMDFPTYRVQAWDFSDAEIPDVTDRKSFILVLTFKNTHTEAVT